MDPARILAARGTLDLGPIGEFESESESYASRTPYYALDRAPPSSAPAAFRAGPHSFPIDPADGLVGPFFLGFCLQALGRSHAAFISSPPQQPQAPYSMPPAFCPTRCQRWTDLMTVIGMGVVLVLSISYFHDVASRHKPPVDTSGRLGVVLVALSLVFNLAQTILDLYRGYVVCLTLAILLPSNRSSLGLLFQALQPRSPRVNRSLMLLRTSERHSLTRHHTPRYSAKTSPTSSPS